MIPLDPPFAQDATVGGVLAANQSGPRRRGYGTARDMVIGMTFATLEGKLIQTGGMVVKNVAGLDMAKMMIGSFGTLAAIATVNFRVHPDASRHPHLRPEIDQARRSHGCARFRLEKPRPTQRARRLQDRRGLSSPGAGERQSSRARPLLQGVVRRPSPGRARGSQALGGHPRVDARAFWPRTPKAPWCASPASSPRSARFWTACRPRPSRAPDRAWCTAISPTPRKPWAKA